MKSSVAEPDILEAITALMDRDGLDSMIRNSPEEPPGRVDEGARPILD